HSLFFSSRRRHTRFSRDWSSDVCSSDLTHILGQIRTGQRVDHFQTVRLSKTGDAINISLSVSPVRDHTGRIIGASKIARDITSQVKAEKAIRLYASNLEAINSIGKSIAQKLEVSKVM